MSMAGTWDEEERRGIEITRKRLQMEVEAENFPLDLVKQAFLISERFCDNHPCRGGKNVSGLTSRRHSAAGIRLRLIYRRLSYSLCSSFMSQNK